MYSEHQMMLHLLRYYFFNNPLNNWKLGILEMLAIGCFDDWSSLETVISLAEE